MVLYIAAHCKPKKRGKKKERGEKKRREKEEERRKETFHILLHTSPLTCTNPPPYTWEHACASFPGKEIKAK